MKKYTSQIFLEGFMDIFYGATLYPLIGSIAQPLTNSISNMNKSIKYSGANCSEFEDPNERDECDIRAISKQISGLRKNYDKCNQSDPTCQERINSSISTLQRKSKELESQLYNRKAAGV